MRFLKLLGIVSAALAGIVLLVLGVLFFIGDDAYRKIVIAAVEHHTGRELRIDGDFTVTFFPELTVEARDLSLANIPGSKNPHMARVRQMNLRADWRELFGGVLDMDLVADDVFVSVEQDTDGTSNWVFADAKTSAREDSAGFLLRPRFRHTSVSNARLLVDDARRGKTADIGVRALRLVDEEGELRVHLDGAIDATPVTLDGHLGTVAAIVGNLPTELRLNGSAGDAAVDLQGTWGPLTPHPVLQLRGALQAGSLGFIEALLPDWLGGLGPLEADFTLVGRGGVYGLSGLRAVLEGDGEHLKLDGHIDDLEQFSGVVLDVDIETPYFRDFIDATGLEFDTPMPRYVRASGTLQGDVANLSADIQRLEARDEGVKAQFQGTVGRLLSLGALQGSLALSADDAASLDTYLPFAMPAPGAITLSGEIDNVAGPLRAETIRLEFTGERLSGSATGAIGDLATMTGVQLEGDFKTRSLRALGELFGASLAETPPFSARLQLDAPSGFGEPVRLRGSAQGRGLAVSADGGIGNLAALAGIDLMVTLDAQVPQPWLKAAGLEIPEMAPISARGRLLSERDGHAFRDATIKLGIGAANADLEFREAPGCVNVSGKVHFDSLDLRSELSPEVQIESVETPAGAGSKGDKEPERVVTLRVGDSPRVFSSEPFPAALLTQCGVDLVFSMAEVLAPDTRFEAVEAHLHIADGRLTIDPIRSSARGGRLEGGFHVDAGTEPSAFRLKLDGDDVTLARYTGTYNFEVDLEGAGDSMADLMASLGGRVTVTAGDVMVQTSTLGPVEREILQNLSTSGELAQLTEVECFFAHLDIRDGVVDLRKNMVVQTSHVTWSIGGLVDLGAESLEIYARSRKRRGVDLLGSFASLVQVRGSLVEPRLVLNPAGVLGKSLEFTAHIATGGITGVLWHLFDRNEANRDACKDVFSQPDAAGAVAPSAESPANKEPRGKREDYIQVH
jgi:uncharacterized protein involved in outer membrane biogenesis